MNITKIKLRNFVSFKSAEFDISGTNPVIIVGDNGAGKSSLVKDSITWCLFGKARASNDEVIHNDEDEAEVQITFTLDNVKYIVTRYRSRPRRVAISGHSALHVWRDDIEITGATISETQTAIERLLGMSYEIFTNTACIEQGRADSFSALSPKEAKNVIMNILQLGVYNDYLIRAKAGANTLASKLIAAEGKQDASKQEIEELTKALQDSEKQKTDLQSIKIEQSKALTAFTTVNEKLRALELIVSQKLSESSKLETYIEQLRSAIDNVQDRLSKIQKAGERGKCPLCLTDLTADAVEIVKTKLDKRIGRYTLEIQSSESRCRELTSSDSIHERLQLNQQQKAIENEIEGLRDKACEIYDAAGFIRAKEEEMQKAKEKLEELTLSIKKITREWSQYNVLTKAFDRNGIPTLIIENVIPEIEETANKILAILSSGTMTLELVTQRELKTGETGDTLEIRVKNLKNTRKYAILSSGERLRVDLALRIALSTILARRNNFKCETLLIDEGFGSLDEMGKQKFVELSRELQDTFKRVIIITHTNLTDYYSDLITVRKVDGVSEIR